MIEEMNKVKALFPDNVEKIIISKDDYDRLTGELTLENIELKQEKERLQKENNDLRKIYQRTYKHLFEKGNDELARYFQAQIDECHTFYVEPIIDYYEETKRLHSIIKEVREEIRILATNSDIADYQAKKLFQILDKVEEK